jgi:hypothetical protein
MKWVGRGLYNPFVGLAARAQFQNITYKTLLAFITGSNVGSIMRKYLLINFLSFKYSA